MQQGICVLARLLPDAKQMQPGKIQGRLGGAPFDLDAAAAAPVWAGGCHAQRGFDGDMNGANGFPFLLGRSSHAGDADAYVYVQPGTRGGGPCSSRFAAHGAVSSETARAMAAAARAIALAVSLLTAPCASKISAGTP